MRMCGCDTGSIPVRTYCTLVDTYCTLVGTYCTLVGTPWVCRLPRLYLDMDEQAKFRLWLLFRARKPRYRGELKKRSATESMSTATSLALRPRKQKCARRKYSASLSSGSDQTTSCGSLSKSLSGPA